MKEGWLLESLRRVRGAAEEVRDDFERMTWAADMSPWRISRMVTSLNPFAHAIDRAFAAADVSADWRTTLDRDPSMGWLQRVVVKSAGRTARRFDRLVALTHLLEQRAVETDEETHNPLAADFYTFKAAVALLLGRQDDRENGDEVVVATWDMRERIDEHGGCEWQELTTGYGWWDWVYSIQRDSTA